MGTQIASAESLVHNVGYIKDGTSRSPRQNSAEGYKLMTRMSKMCIPSTRYKMLTETLAKLSLGSKPRRDQTTVTYQQIATR